MLFAVARLQCLWVTWSTLFVLHVSVIISAHNVASRLQRVGLIVIPFCLSVCLDVCRSFRDLQPTTIDRSQPNLVGLFGSPISHTFGATGKNIPNVAYFQRQPFNAYSCHCERDASCHMTCTVYSCSFFMLDLWKCTCACEKINKCITVYPLFVEKSSR